MCVGGYLEVALMYHIPYNTILLASLTSLFNFITWSPFAESRAHAHLIKTWPSDSHCAFNIATGHIAIAIAIAIYNYHIAS